MTYQGAEILPNLFDHWERRYSKGGTPYWRWEPPVPRIHNSLTDCVVYLYPTEDHAMQGDRVGGSGFLVSIPLPSHSDGSLVFVVSNQHVIRNAPVVRLNAKDRSLSVAEVPRDQWIPHPDGDDLAIAHISAVRVGLHRFNTVPIGMFLSEEIIRQWDIGIGDDVFVVGRFINHEGIQQNSPSLRFGNIAQMPGDKLNLDTGVMQEAFIVEAKSIGGYSGSPVFVHMLPLSSRPKPDDSKTMLIVPHPGTGPWLLGVDCCHIRSWEPVCDRDGYEIGQGWKVSSNTGMMGVIPAWKLTEMFDLPIVREMIKIADEQLTRVRNDSSGATDSVSEGPTQ